MKELKNILEELRCIAFAVETIGFKVSEVCVVVLEEVHSQGTDVENWDQVCMRRRV